MSGKNLAKPVALAVGAALAGSLVTISTANAETGISPFAMTHLSAGYMLGAADGHEEKGAEGKCGEGKCGEGKEKDAEGKCGEGKCGGEGHKDAEGKCGEGKCGGDKEE
ncbi:MAG TPA: hypothetical protein VIS04_06820 [Woeseiaceae bacterium]